MKHNVLLLLVLVSLLASCAKQQGTLSTHTKPTKIADYLYDITYTDYSATAGERYAETINNMSRGAACTVVRTGDFVGRNYDYLYSNMAEFVIHVPAAEGRYASIGVAASLFELTAEKAESDPYGQFFDILPYVTVDGMNEKGVFCDVNMNYSEHDYQTSGTNPDASVTLYASMAVRYVLDNCASASEACRALQKVNIVFLAALGEYHFFIADRNESWVVEFVDNKMVCDKTSSGVLTNFYVLSDEFRLNGYYGTRPCGTERYEYAMQHVGECVSVDEMSSLMRALRYSRLYDLSTSPYWYSEYYGETYNGFVIDANTPKDDYADYVKEACEDYKNRTRDYLKDYWITTHTSVYDLKNLTLRVYAQENYDHPYEFSLK